MLSFLDHTTSGGIITVGMHVGAHHFWSAFLLHWVELCGKHHLAFLCVPQIDSRECAFGTVLQDGREQPVRGG